MLRRFLAGGILCSLFLAMAGVAVAADPAGSTAISLSAAVDLAIKHSPGLEKARLDTELAKMQEDSARDAYNGVQLVNRDPATGYIIYDTTTEKAENGYLAAEANKEIKEKSLEAQRDGITFNVYQKYYAVLEAQKDLAVKRLAAERKAADLKVARAKYQAGMLAGTAVRQYETGYAASQSDITSAESSLSNAYNTLNELLGLPAGTRPELDADVRFVPLEVKDLEAKISLILSDDPNLWAARRSADLSRETISGSGSERDTALLKADQAEIQVKMLQENLGRGLRQTHKAMADLERQYEAALEQKVLAQESLRQAQLFFDVGMGTRSEILAADAGLAQVEQALLTLTTKYEALKFQFAKPWAGAGGGA